MPTLSTADSESAPVASPSDDDRDAPVVVAEKEEEEEVQAGDTEKGADENTSSEIPAVFSDVLEDTQSHEAVPCVETAETETETETPSDTCMTPSASGFFSSSRPRPCTLAITSNGDATCDALLSNRVAPFSTVAGESGLSSMSSPATLTATDRKRRRTWSVAPVSIRSYHSGEEIMLSPRAQPPPTSMMAAASSAPAHPVSSPLASAFAEAASHDNDTETMQKQTEEVPEQKHATSEQVLSSSDADVEASFSDAAMVAAVAADCRRRRTAFGDRRRTFAPKPAFNPDLVDVAPSPKFTASASAAAADAVESESALSTSIAANAAGDVVAVDEAEIGFARVPRQSVGRMSTTVRDRRSIMLDVSIVSAFQTVADDSIDGDASMIAAVASSSSPSSSLATDEQEPVSKRGRSSFHTHATSSAAAGSMDVVSHMNASTSSEAYQTAMDVTDVEYPGSYRTLDADLNASDEMLLSPMKSAPMLNTTTTTAATSSASTRATPSRKALDQSMRMTSPFAAPPRHSTLGASVFTESDAEPVTAAFTAAAAAVAQDLSESATVKEQFISQEGSDNLFVAVTANAGSATIAVATPTPMASAAVSSAVKLNSVISSKMNSATASSVGVSRPVTARPPSFAVSRGKTGTASSSAQPVPKGTFRAAVPLAAAASARAPLPANRPFRPTQPRTEAITSSSSSSSVAPRVASITRPGTAMRPATATVGVNKPAILHSASTVGRADSHQAAGRVVGDGVENTHPARPGVTSTVSGGARKPVASAAGALPRVASLSATSKNAVFPSSQVPSRVHAGASLVRRN